MPLPPNPSAFVAKLAPPAVPPPPPAIGASSNPFANIGMGSVAAVGTNAITANQLGPEVSQVAMGINLIMQIIKQFPKINQNFWWPFILLVLGIGIFAILSYQQGVLDVATSVKNGFAAAFQAALNYHSFRVAGINIMPPETRGGE